MEEMDAAEAKALLPTISNATPVSMAPQNLSLTTQTFATPSSLSSTSLDALKLT